ncbi:MAG: protein TolR [Gammaproteobacteria bacterium]|nr:protein TolR [Gammaproteobacteria bacterium]
MSVYQPGGRVRRKRMSEINVVPYIDVMLVLLIIFMVTAPLLTQGVKVELPKADSRNIESKGQEPLIVSVDQQGRFYFNIGDKPDKPVDAKNLTARIKAVLRHRKDSTVYVKGDRNVAYGEVVQVMALLKQSGVEHVGLVTRLPDVAK